MTNDTRKLAPNSQKKLTMPLKVATIVIMVVYALSYLSLQIRVHGTSLKIDGYIVGGMLAFVLVGGLVAWVCGFISQLVPQLRNPISRRKVALTGTVIFLILYMGSFIFLNKFT
jgi:uncharacterized oligopeptide transporter (OPT) family protein